MMYTVFPRVYVTSLNNQDILNNINSRSIKMNEGELEITGTLSHLQWIFKHLSIFDKFELKLRM